MQSLHPGQIHLCGFHARERLQLLEQLTRRLRIFRCHARPHLDHRGQRIFVKYIQCLTEAGNRLEIFQSLFRRDIGDFGDARQRPDLLQQRIGVLRGTIRGEIQRDLWLALPAGDLFLRVFQRAVQSGGQGQSDGDDRYGHQAAQRRGRHAARGAGQVGGVIMQPDGRRHQ